LEWNPPAACCEAFRTLAAPHLFAPPGMMPESHRLAIAPSPCRTRSPRWEDKSRCQEDKLNAGSGHRTTATTACPRAASSLTSHAVSGWVLLRWTCLLLRPATWTDPRSPAPVPARADRKPPWP
jgi:hypothetical protein